MITIFTRVSRPHDHDDYLAAAIFQPLFEAATPSSAPAGSSFKLYSSTSSFALCRSVSDRALSFSCCSASFAASAFARASFMIASISQLAKEWLMGGIGGRLPRNTLIHTRIPYSRRYRPNNGC